MDLKHAAFIIFKNKYKIIAFVLASLVIVVIGLRLKPPTYKASAQILVKLGREISVPSQDVMEGVGYVHQKRREDIYAEVEILESTHLIEEIVNKVGQDKIMSSSRESEKKLNAGPLSFFRNVASSARHMAKGLIAPGEIREFTPFEESVLAIQKKLNVEPVLRSDTIKISYSDTDPEMAEEVLGAYLDKYFERHIEVHKGAKMQDLFQPQASSYKKKLAEIEDRLEELTKEKNVFSIDVQRTEIIRHMSDIREELDQTKRAILKKEEKIVRIGDQISSQSRIIELPDTEDRNPVIDTLNDKLVELELKKQELLHNYSPESRTVSNVNEEILLVQEQLRKEQKRVLFTNQKDLSVLRIREVALNREIDGYVAELKNINIAEVQRSRLERERKILESNYLRYTKELEEARISEVMDLAKITNVRVIQPVSVSMKPEGLGNALILMLTAGISLFLSAGIVFLFEYLDHSLGTARDVERFLDLPVLGSIRERK